MTAALAVIAASLGVCMGLSPLIQIKRIVRLRHSEDISIIYLAVITMGAGSWVAYGMALPDLAIVIPNAVGVLTNLTAIAVVMKYRS